MKDPNHTKYTVFACRHDDMIVWAYVSGMLEACLLHSCAYLEHV